MAYIYGNATQSSTTRASARRKDILLRVALPLFFIMVLAGAGLYAFKQSQPWISALFAVFFVAAVLRFEELGLTVSHYLSHSQASARGGQVVAKALEQLPNEYHVFHDLHVSGARIDHAVVGPNGFFTIKVGSHLGNISASGESLRLNGWPFLMDMLSGCWNQTQKLTKHLGLHYSGGLHPCPVLCFSRASVGIAGLVRGALVVEAGNLVPAIMSHEEALPSDKMLQLVEKLSEMVGAKNVAPLCSQDDSQPAPQPAHSSKPSPNAPLCSRCGYKPTPGDFELFPGECPKCGRLYAFEPDESEAAPAGPSRRSVWKPSVPQLAMAALLIAGGAGYLAYSQGLLARWQSVVQAPATPQNEAPARNDDPPASPITAIQSAGNSSQVAAPPPEMATPQTESTTNATEPVFTQSDVSPEAPAAHESDTAANATLATNANSTGNATLTATQGPAQDLETENATAPAAKAHASPKTSITKPANPFDQGKLVVTASRPVTLWFTNQQTFKEFGPYVVSGKKDILLPKGFYSVVYLENGKHRQTTMSFLSDHGQLDF